MTSHRPLLALLALFVFSPAIRGQAPPTAVSSGASLVPSSPSPAGRITLHWTDRGVGYWDSSLAMFHDFRGVPNGGVTSVSPAGQILMPMPALDQIPTSEEGWRAL